MRNMISAASGDPAVSSKSDQMPIRPSRLNGKTCPRTLWKSLLSRCEYDRTIFCGSKYLLIESAEFSSIEMTITPDRQEPLCSWWSQQSQNPAANGQLAGHASTCRPVSSGHWPDGRRFGNYRENPRQRRNLSEPIWHVLSTRQHSARDLASAGKNYSANKLVIMRDLPTKASIEGL